jgi:hypothetical protein
MPTPAKRPCAHSKYTAGCFSCQQWWRMNRRKNAPPAMIPLPQHGDILACLIMLVNEKWAGKELYRESG